MNVKPPLEDHTTTRVRTDSPKFVYNETLMSSETEAPSKLGTGGLRSEPSVGCLES
jgi:hypothetical protein